MATDSIMGLFTTPEQYQQQQRQALYEQAVKEAQLDPYQQARVNLQTGVQGLAQAGAGALGVQDPMLKVVAARQQAIQGLDMANPKDMMAAAQRLQSIGDLQGAYELSTKARALYSESLKQGLDERRVAAQEEKNRIAEDVATKRFNAQMEAQAAQERRFLAALAAKGEKQQTADDKAAVRIGQNTTFESLITEGDSLTKTIDANKDAFSLTGRASTAIKSVMSPSAPSVQAVSDVDSYLKKARNAYLLAAKGTQTEGDAQRAWEEFAGRLDFSSAEGAKRSVERIQKELATQKKANEAYLKSRGIQSGPALGTAENPIKLK